MAGKLVCGIDIDCDKAFISFASLRRGEAVFLKELCFEHVQGKDLIKFFQDNMPEIKRLVEETCSGYKASLGKIFIKLPPGLETMNVAEEVVALGQEKKIGHSDLDFIKKYLEDNALDWDDCCIHHFPLNFGLEGKAFNNLPIGLYAKRLRVKSLLVTVKDRLRHTVNDIFDAYDLPFGGFVATGISDFSATFSVPCGINAVVNIGYENTLLTVVDCGVIRVVESFAFGLNGLLAQIAQDFNLPISLIKDIFDIYISLYPLAQSAPLAGKEINLRNGDSYTNISINAVNTSAADYLRRNIMAALSRLEGAQGPVVISFLGRLSRKDGFNEFVKSFVSYSVADPVCQEGISSSFGCARYGVGKFLESSSRPRLSLSSRLVKLYKDYF